MNKQEILRQLEETNEQINLYKKRLKSSDLCEDLYDSAILRKAILIKELENCDKNPIIEGVKNLFKKREETLICDYFSGRGK